MNNQEIKSLTMGRQISHSNTFLCSWHSVTVSEVEAVKDGWNFRGEGRPSNFHSIFVRDKDVDTLLHAGQVERKFVVGGFTFREVWTIQ
jgi:hypothetical protein